MAEKEVKEKNEPKFKPVIEPDNWESGRKVSQASYLQRDDGTKGISFKLGTKNNYMSRPRWAKTIWIDEELDLPLWLNWFIKTLKKGYFTLFGKKVKDIDEEKEYYKTKIEELTRNLTQTQTLLEEAEKREQSFLEKQEYARKVQSNLAEYKTIFGKFKELIEKSKLQDKGEEEKIKTEILNNRWLLGLECSVEAKNQRVDNQTQIDLHIKTKYDQDRIFEVKSPNEKPFIRIPNKNNNRRLIITDVLADGLSELVIYLRRTDIHSEQRSKANYGIQKASGYILMGYNLDTDELEMLSEINFHTYPHIQIMTYNDLLKNIERELEIIEGVSKNESNRKN